MCHTLDEHVENKTAEMMCLWPLTAPCNPHLACFTPLPFFFFYMGLVGAQTR